MKYREKFVYISVIVIQITKFLNIICFINDTPTPSIQAHTAYQNEQKSQVGHLTDFWFVILHY